MLRVLAAFLVLGIAACGSRLDRHPQLRLGNLSEGGSIRFCIRAADAEVFTPVPPPEGGSLGYRAGESVSLRVEPGPKVIRVARGGEDCLAASSVAEDLSVDLSRNSTTTVVLADRLRVTPGDPRAARERAAEGE